MINYGESCTDFRNFSVVTTILFFLISSRCIRASSLRYVACQVRVWFNISAAQPFCSLRSEMYLSAFRIMSHCCLDAFQHFARNHKSQNFCWVFFSFLPARNIVSHLRSGSPVVYEPFFVFCCARLCKKAEGNLVSNKHIVASPVCILTFRTRKHAPMEPEKLLRRVYRSFAFHEQHENFRFWLAGRGLGSPVQ